MTDHSTEIERHPGRRASWMAVLLVVALAITLAGIFPFRQMIAQQRQVATAEAQLAALATENARLEAERDALGTPAEIERVAREDLGLVRPGETGYLVETPPTPGPPTPVPATEDPDAGRSFVERLLDFFTGRDLAPED